MRLSKSDLGVNENARRAALAAAMLSYSTHKDAAKNKDKIVVVNMEEPSYRKRLYVWDLNKQEFTRNHHVSHGTNSANPTDKAYAIHFSNVINSHESSKGAMVTKGTYTGKHGRSLKLGGLEKGINDNVENRSIVIHAADYVTDGYILSAGRVGCSYGCPAVDPAIAQDLIDDIKNGTFFYVYF